MTLFLLMSPRRKEQISSALAHWKVLKIEPRLKTTCAKGHPLRQHQTKRGLRRFCPICAGEQTRQSEIRRGKRKGTYRHTNQREMF